MRNYALYIGQPFKTLEMEQQAHVRALVRKGVLFLVRENGRTVVRLSTTKEQVNT